MRPILEKEEVPHHTCARCPVEARGHVGARFKTKKTSWTAPALLLAMLQLFYLAAVSACLGSAGMGTTLGYSSPAIPSLKKGHPGSTPAITAEGETWFGSLMTVGGLLGGLGAGSLAEHLGRRKSLVLSSVGFVFGWILIGTSRNIVALCAGRMITGLFTGLVSLVVPLYVSEVSRPGVRGALGSGIQLAVTIGILGVFLAGKYVNWSTLAYLCIIPNSLLALLMLFMAESPRWLLTKGRRNDAMKSLQFLFGKNIDHEAECRSIEEAITSSRGEKFCISELGQPWVYKPITISLFLMFAQQFSGINAVMFYAVSIFEQAHTSIPSEDCMIIIGAVQVVATLVSTMVMDKCGRRMMLLLSAGLLGTSLAVLGAYHYVRKTHGDDIVAHVGWLPLVCLSVFIIGFSCGMGPVPWLMMGELLPVRVLGFASSLCTGCNWALAFVVTKEFSYMVSVLDAHGTYWFFAGVMAVSFCVILAAVPETKGKTLEQIEMTFRGMKVQLGGVEAADNVEAACMESTIAHRPSSCGPSDASMAAAPVSHEDPPRVATPQDPGDAPNDQLQQPDATEPLPV